MSSGEEAWGQELSRVRMVSHALAYARKGWRVLPLWWPRFACVCACPAAAECGGNVGMHPILMGKDGSGGANGASTDEVTIRHWWAKWPHANIGIATGAVSGFVVLDVDTN